MPAMLERQQFKDSGSDVTESKISKRRHVNPNDNEKEQDLGEYDNKDDRYSFFFLFSQKVSNRLTNLGKEIKSLNHLV